MVGGIFLFFLVVMVAGVDLPGGLGTAYVPEVAGW